MSSSSVRALVSQRQSAFPASAQRKVRSPSGVRSRSADALFVGISLPSSPRSSLLFVASSCPNPQASVPEVGPDGSTPPVPPVVPVCPTLNGLVEGGPGVLPGLLMACVSRVRLRSCPLAMMGNCAVIPVLGGANSKAAGARCRPAQWGLCSLHMCPPPQPGAGAQGRKWRSKSMVPTVPITFFV